MTIKARRAKRPDSVRGGKKRNGRKRSPTKKFLEINRHLFPAFGTGKHQFTFNPGDLPNGKPRWTAIRAVR